MDVLEGDIQINSNYSCHFSSVQCIVKVVGIIKVHQSMEYRYKFLVIYVQDPCQKSTSIKMRINIVQALTGKI